MKSELGGALITLSRSFSFEAAHKLPQHDGKCKNLHGHTYTCELSVLGSVRSDTGMLLDFGILKRISDAIVADLDHTYLNDKIRLEPPTAEAIAYYIAWQILEMDALPQDCSISVSVSEGLNNKATTLFLRQEPK